MWILFIEEFYFSMTTFFWDLANEKLRVALVACFDNIFSFEMKKKCVMNLDRY